MKHPLVKGAFAALAVLASSVSAFAVTFTWTGKAGNNLYCDKNNWSISGSSTRGGPSWTEAGVVDTDQIGGDVTIILNTSDCHPDVFQTKGSHKVTVVADANNYTFQPYWPHLYAKDNEFDVNVSLHSVNGGYREWSLYSSATFKRDVTIPDNTTINNRSNVDGSCLGVSPNAIHFYGTVNVASGKALGLRRAPYTTAATVHFHGPVVCDELRFGLGWVSGYAYFYSKENQIGNVSWAYSNFVCGNDDVYPAGNALTWPSTLVNPASNGNELYWVDSSTYTAFNLNGYSQKVAKVAYEHESRRPWIDSSKPATLTLDGSGTAVANVIVGGKVSLVVDSEDLVQDFRDSQSVTEGSVEVRRGALRLSGASSFVNVKDLVIGAGATFEVASTATGAMGGLTNVAVAAGGTLKVGSGVVSPFGSELSICLESGATVESDTDFTVANGLYVDGEPVQSGTYSGAAWQKGTGKVTVNAPTVSATYVWTGLGGNSLVSNAGNWEGGVLPTFTSSLATYVIPVAGSKEAPATLVVDTPMTCKGLHFCAADGGYVVLTAADGGKLSIVKGEVNVTNATGKAVSAEIAAPVEFEGSLAVQAGPDDAASSHAVSFSGSLNSIGKAEISKRGCGAWSIEGDANVIQGDIHNYKGRFTAYGANPVGGGTEYALCNYPDANDAVTFIDLDDTTINRNVVTRNPNDSCGPTIRVMGKVTVNGNIGNNAGGTTNSGHMRIHLGTGNGVAGECVVNGNIVAHNNGFFILTGAKGYLTCTGLIDCVRVYCDSAGTFLLDVARQARGLAGKTYGWYMKIPLRISSDNCIWRETQGDQHYMCYSETAGIDLNGHTLTLANFGTDAASFAAGGCFIKGGAGSKLKLVGDENDDVGMRVLEEASLVRAGTGTSTIADACTSTGTLDVTGGTVRFTAAGSWTNVTCVTVGGGTDAALLALSGRKALGKRTVLKLLDNGKVEIPEGVTARVGELWLNDVKQTSGLWGALGSGASSQSAFFEGKGCLFVGETGLQVIIR